MSDDRKTILVNNGYKEFAVNHKELTEYLSSISEDRRKELTFKGKVDSTYTNQDGLLVREQLTGEQVVRRMALGEQPVNLGASDPKLQALNRQEKARAEKNVTDDENVLALWNAIEPGLIGRQHLEDYVLGEGESTRIRSEIADTNKTVSALGGIGKGLMFGGAAGGVVKGLTGAKTLRGIGALAVDEVSIEAALYQNYLVNNNLPFVAEDFGRQVLKGAIFAAPFYAGTAVRGALKLVGKGAVNKGRLLQEGLIAGAVVSPKGSGKAAGLARGGAAVGLGTKFARRLQGMFGKATGLTDEIADAQKALDFDNVRIDKLTPEKLRRMTPSEYRGYLDDVGGLLEDARTLERLNKIDPKVIHGPVDKLRSAVVATRNSIRNFNKQLRTPKFKKKTAPQWTAEGRALWAQQADAAMYRVEASGMDASALKKTLGSKKPHLTYGQWAQARLDALLRRSEGGGVEAAQAIKEFMENGDAWGRPLAARGVRINTAIDKIANAYDDLGKLNLPKDLSDVVAKDATRLNDISKSTAAIHDGLAALYDEGLLTESFRRGVANQTIKTGEAVANGTKGFMDASLINKARDRARGLHRKRQLDVPQTPEQLRVAAGERSAETVGRLGRFAKTGKELLTGGAKTADKLLNTAARAGQAGVLGFNTMDEEDRNVMYDVVSTAVTMYTGAPEALEETMADHMGGYLETPEMSIMAGSNANRAIHWLRGELPKEDRSLYGKQLPVSKMKRNVFLEKFVASADPMSVAEASLLGRVTPGMIAAFRVTNPELYAEVGVAASELLAEADPIEAPRQVVNGLNQLLGGISPLYQGAMLLELQTNYAQTQMQQQTYGGAGGMNASSNPQEPGNQFTFSQRLASY